MEFSAPIREKIEHYRLEREQRAHEKAEKKRLELEGKRRAERQGQQGLRKWLTQQWVTSLRLEPDETGFVSTMDHFVYRKFLRGETPDCLREILDGPEINKPALPSVYFLRADNGLVKIGRTTNFQQRLRDLQGLLPFGVELIHIIESEDYVALEKSYHRRFANQRVRGEWFALSNDDLQAIKVEQASE